MQESSARLEAEFRALPLASRLSADGQWWGVRGYWRSAVSADGSLRWDGSTFSAIGRGQAPECLETLDHQSLEANRTGRMTLRQVGRLAPRFLFGWLFMAGVVTWGCFFDLAGCLIWFALGLALTIVAVPVAALLLLLEWGLGLRREEGPLLRVYDGRRRFVSVAGTRVVATGMNIDRMAEGAPHRLYFTRVFHRLINYERLGGDALTRFEDRTLQEPQRARRDAKSTEVTVWVSELKAGTLPPVCAKSGRPAESRLMFWFVTRGLSVWVFGLLAPGRQANGRLPLTNRWRITFIVFRAAALVVAGIGVLALLAGSGFPESTKAIVVGISFGALAASMATYLLYAGLRPKGVVYSNSKGQLYVILRDVHPAFVQAVNAMNPRPLER